jgi:hypothetical protein
VTSSRGHLAVPQGTTLSPMPKITFHDPATLVLLRVYLQLSQEVPVIHEIRWGRPRALIFFPLKMAREFFGPLAVKYEVGSARPLHVACKHKSLD